MSENDCVFCRIVSGEIPVTKVYEDKVIVAFLDIGPVADGHTLVVPRQHYRQLHDCPAELLGQVCSRLGEIVRAVAAGTNSDGYNVLCNNGSAAGQLVEHLHFHVIPRSSGDGVFDHWPSYKYEEGRIEEIAADIQKSL
ncbi:MAG: HIT family protein [Planctomycetota bacterium]|jgi:histidine triad (HIT) family protein